MLAAHGGGQSGRENTKHKLISSMKKYEKIRTKHFVGQVI